MLNSYKKQSGFTLIEMIVSLGVFAVVVTTAVGALLAIISANKQLQAEQSIMTNLSFAMDTMTREIRTGYNYYCNAYENYSAGGPNNIFTDGNDHEGVAGASKRDCPLGRQPSTHELQGVSFYEGGQSITSSVSNSQRIAYFFDGNTKEIKRRVGNGPAQSVVSSGLEIINAEFYVTGSEPQSENGNDVKQPTVTIYLEAKEKNNPTGKIYSLQTTVTQRILDL
ncbi:MAG: type II secretion system protein [Candidatus Nomurabacteria bacterium]|nr:MAG: type II secretion system protein [Candidatus Nomurabacteria bacterium]